MLRTRALFPCLPYSESFMKRDGYVALMLDDDRYGPPWILIEPLLIHTMCLCCGTPVLTARATMCLCSLSVPRVIAAVAVVTTY
jgi:hypothetical protein